MRKQTPLFLSIFIATLLLNPGLLNAYSSQIVYLRAAEVDIRIGQASWYSESDPGINERTANNEIFDDAQLTAAMWDVPFDQRVRVTNLANGKSVIVRVNDRGPHRRFVQEGRLIDLTKKAFSTIASLDKGLIDIELELL